MLHNFLRQFNWLIVTRYVHSVHLEADYKSFFNHQGLNIFVLVNKPLLALS